MSTPEKYILQLSGMAGSGKSSITEKLSNDFGFEVITVSRLLGDFANMCGMSLNSRNDYRGFHARLIAENNDPNIVARIICDSPKKRICVDGMRVPANAHFIRKFGQGVVSDVVWLDSPSLEVRHERCRDRLGTKQEMKSQSLAEFVADELPEVFTFDPAEPNLYRMFLMADYILPAGTEDEMYEKLIDFLNNKGHIPV